MVFIHSPDKGGIDGLWSDIRGSYTLGGGFHRRYRYQTILVSLHITLGFHSNGDR